MYVCLVDTKCKLHTVSHCVVFVRGAGRLIVRSEEGRGNFAVKIVEFLDIKSRYPRHSKSAQKLHKLDNNVSSRFNLFFFSFLPFP